MSQTKRRKVHTLEYKAKVGFEALRCGKTVNQVAQEFDVHPVQVGQWKKAIQEQAKTLFQGRRGPKPLDAQSAKVDLVQRPLRERLMLDITIEENLALLVKAHSTIAADVGRAEIHSLEFGLQVGQKQKEGTLVNLDDVVTRKTTKGKRGEIQLRPNIATSENDYSVVTGRVL